MQPVAEKEIYKPLEAYQATMHPKMQYSEGSMKHSQAKKPKDSGFVKALPLAI